MPFWGTQHGGDILEWDKRSFHDHPNIPGLPLGLLPSFFILGRRDAMDVVASTPLNNAKNGTDSEKPSCFLELCA